MRIEILVMTVNTFPYSLLIFYNVGSVAVNLKVYEQVKHLI